MGPRAGHPVGGRKMRKQGTGGQREERRILSSGRLPKFFGMARLAKAVSSRVNTVDS